MKLPGRVMDETGKRFGMLTAIRQTASRNNLRFWLYRCDCGREIERSRSKVASAARAGRLCSCGCALSAIRAENGRSNKTHGWSQHRIYGIWRQMHERCYNPECNSYSWYGARGIDVCQEWHSLEAFIEWALANGYDESLTIERGDNDKGYSPENCRWIPNEQQAWNTRRLWLISHNGETKHASAWAREKGVSVQTLSSRKRYGWSERDILSASGGSK